MKGIDASHWQGSIDWEKVKKTGYAFTVIKATQGVGMLDSNFAKNKNGARNAGLLCGFYHFANGGDAQKEADYFLSKLGQLLQGEFLVLDWETKHANPVEWCRIFLQRVKEKTGIKPILYINRSTENSLDWSPVVSGDYGLWIADYGINNGAMNQKPGIKNWKFFAIWQFTSRGKVDGISGNTDLNFSDMDIETLKRYGVRAVCAHCCPIHCK